MALKLVLEAAKAIENRWERAEDSHLQLILSDMYSLYSIANKESY